MLIEGSYDRAVAFAEGMDAAQRDAEDDRVVEHIRYVEVGVAVWDHEDIVALIVIRLSIFDHDVVLRVDIYIKQIQTSIAGHLDGAFTMKRAVIYVMFLFEIKMNLHIRTVDAGVLHILEKLRVAYEILLKMPVGQLGKLHFIGREFSHNNAIYLKSATKIVSFKIITNYFGHFFSNIG